MKILFMVIELNKFSFLIIGSAMATSGRRKLKSGQTLNLITTVD